MTHHLISAMAALCKGSIKFHDDIGLFERSLLRNKVQMRLWQRALVSSCVVHHEMGDIFAQLLDKRIS